ncbi:MAG: hypothetical protein M0Z94_18865 [Dehalococcoidales bacterium]|nr:hypothetical protein [Dehalococcoidales bacterium]
MKDFKQLGATIALLASSIWWAAVAMIARAGMVEADTTRIQLFWLLLSAVAVVVAAALLYGALVFRPTDDDLELELLSELSPSRETDEQGRDR